MGFESLEEAPAMAVERLEIRYTKPINSLFMSDGDVIPYPYIWCSIVVYFCLYISSSSRT